MPGMSLSLYYQIYYLTLISSHPIVNIVESEAFLRKFNLSFKAGMQSISTEAIKLDCKCKGGAGNTGIKLELMTLPTIGNNKGCHLITRVTRDCLINWTEYSRPSIKETLWGSCFLFRKGQSQGYSMAVISDGDSESPRHWLRSEDEFKSLKMEIGELEGVVFWDYLAMHAQAAAAL